MTLALIKLAQKTTGDPLPTGVCPPQHACLLESEMVSPSPEWRPLSCGLLSLYQLSAVTGRGACAENSPVLLDQETPVLPITLANFKKDEGFFLLLFFFHFEGALIVLTVTQGRKPGVTPRPPNLPEPTWPFSDSTAPGSLSSVPGSPSVSSVCWNPHVKLTKDRDLQDGGSVEALKQKIKALLCPPLPQPFEIVDTPNPPSTPSPSFLCLYPPGIGSCGTSCCTGTRGGSGSFTGIQSRKCCN